MRLKFEENDQFLVAEMPAALTAAGRIGSIDQPIKSNTIFLTKRSLSIRNKSEPIFVRVLNPKQQEILDTHQNRQKEW